MDKEILQSFSIDFISSAPFFVSLLDREGNVVFFNREAEKVTGYTVQEISGKDFIDHFICHDKKEAFRDFFFKKMSDEFFPCVMETKDGKTHYMEWTGLRKKSENGDLLLLIGKDLSEIFSKVSTLLSQILHEINNSTTFIIGNTPFLKEAWKDMQEIIENHYAQAQDLEVARLPYAFFKEDYPQVIEDIETGSRRIRNIVGRFREIERMIHDQKK